jgi:quinol monooxygenase YgiN
LFPHTNCPRNRAPARSRRRSVKAEASTLANDDGCLRYEWYRAEETSTYILTERWRDLASVQAHMKAKYLVPIMQKLRLCVPEPSSVMRITKLS